MNDILHLIDRYLADPTMNPRQAPADFERLFLAVHHDDAPEEWHVIRDMMDALTEGEEDYDLLVALRNGAVPAAEKATPPSAIHDQKERLVPAFFLRLAAASVILFVVIGASIHFVADGEKQIVEMERVNHRAASDTAVALAEAPTSAAEPAFPAAEADNPTPSVATTKLMAKSIPASSDVRQTEPPRTDSPLPSATKEQEKSPAAETPVAPNDVPERRIYSCNLLDQIPEE